MKERPSLDEIFMSTPTAASRPSLDEIFMQPTPQSPVQAENVSPQPQGIIDRFSANMQSRGAHLADIVNATAQNQQTVPEGIAQGVMGQVGAAGDVIGTGVEALAKGVYAALPRKAKERVDADMARFSQAAAPFMQQYQRNLEAFNAANPRAGRNLEAVRELGNVLPLGSAPVRKAAGEVADVSGRALRNVAKDTAMYPVEGATTAIKGMKAKSADEISDISRGFSGAANVHYKSMREAGAKILPEKTSELINSIDSTLAARGKLNPVLHPKTMAVLDDLRGAVQDGNIDLEVLDQNRRVLSRIKPTMDNAEDAGMARAAVKAINAVEDNIKGTDLSTSTPEVMNQLKQGRALSRKAIKIEQISDILRQADGDPNRIKAGLTRFINKKSNRDGLTADELDAIMYASRSTTAEKILKMAGKFGIDLGTSLTPGNTVAPLVGGALAGSGGGAAAVVGLGTVARQLQKYMARGKAEKVIEAIQKGKMPKEIYDLPPAVGKQISDEVKKNAGNQ